MGSTLNASVGKRSNRARAVPSGCLCGTAELFLGLVAALGSVFGCGSSDAGRLTGRPCAAGTASGNCAGGTGAGGSAAGMPSDAGGSFDAGAGARAGSGGSGGVGGAGAVGGTGAVGGSDGGGPEGACSAMPCLNGGVCRVSKQAAVCDCPPSWGGERCERAEPVKPDLACSLSEELQLRGPLFWEAVDEAEGGLVMMRQARSGHWYEAYRGGEVRVVSPEGARSAEPLLTVPAATEGEMGLLGLALHPGFEQQPYLYLYYSNLSGEGGAGVLFIDRYRVQSASSVPAVDPGSRVQIFRADRGHVRPFHVGGSIEFDPRASGAQLYFASGDGAGFSERCDLLEPSESASGSCVSQSPTSPHGKLLRFDVSDPTRTQFDEPVVVGVGLRNPFRWSFDSQSGDLWLADVGEARFEELSRVAAEDIPEVGQAPLNFGWPCFEGFAPFNQGSLCEQLGDSVAPVHVYDQSVGVSIIGGRVYRGQRLPEAVGSYHFNDFYPRSGAGAWQLIANQNQDPKDPEDDFLRADIGAGSFVAFAEGYCRELYAVTLGGSIYRLGAKGGSSSP